MLAPVIRLSPLTNEEMLVLIEKLAEIHAGLFGYTPVLTQEELVTFIKIEFGRIGADAHITPREVIRDFIEMLDIVCQNPGIRVAELLQSEQFAYAKMPLDEQAEETSFAEFEI